ncbi:MAG: SusF/SusE family outer membrane protein [Winogradskyella arenosi]
MKTIKLIALLLLAAIGFNACESDDSLTYTAQPAGELSFTNSFLEEYVLIPSASGNLGERFTWNDADFDVETSINYELQKSISGDFTDMEVVGTTAENSYAVTIGELLDYAEEAGLDNDATTEDMPNTGSIYFRVRATIGTDAALEIVSDMQALNLKLIEGDGGVVEEPLLNLFLVGDATAPGWSENNNNPALIRHADNTNMYTYKGFFVGGGEGFKLLETLGQWQPQWGAGENPGEAAVNDGSGSDPSAFAIAADGYYEFNINIDDMTYTLVDYDASAAATYTTVSMIGDSTPGGWDADTDLTQSSFDSHIWSATGVEFVDGELKFRADNDWAVNWGSATAISGFGTQDGANIPVSAGTYDVWFNDLDGGYILIPVE